MDRLLSVRFEAPARPVEPASILASFSSPPGLYLHIPFCSSICPFCPYNKVHYDHALATLYFAGLRREMERYRDASPPVFGSLYIGGGTPTLCLDELEPLLNLLDHGDKQAIEVLPNHMTRDRAERLRKLGFTSVSLGVQSFNKGVLRRLGRPNTVAMNMRAIEVALSRFDCVDVDLIFDVGFGDPQTLLTDMETCFTAGVDQVSTYPLMRFGYTPFGRGKHDRRLEHRLLGEAEALAASYGYHRGSVWTFNRSREVSYSSITRELYLGLGAGSASYSGETFFLNHFGIRQYIAATVSGLPVARVARLGSFLGAAYYLFWQSYAGRVPLQRLHELFGSQHILTAATRMLGATRFVRRTGEDFELTPQGYELFHDLERWVTYHLIEPLWEEMLAEHSA